MFQLKTSDNLNEWQKNFNEYLNWNKRSVAEVVNQKLYFIALRAMQETKKATKEEITNELSQTSKDYPNKTLGEVLVLRDLQAKGKMPKKGSTLARNLAGYVQKLINKRASHIQFLRSGWLPAIKKLDYWNRKADSNSISFSRRFAPKKPQGVKQFGQDKGDVKPALLGSFGSNCRGTIINLVGQGKQSSNSVQPILQAGLDKAVKEEVKSMKLYMQKKWDEQHRRMASKGQVELV